jgi:predicted transcriptional regulator
VAKRDMVVGVRLTADDVAKLDQLAAKTYRGRADILRCLISQATAAEHLDIVIDRALSADSGATCVG